MQKLASLHEVSPCSLRFDKPTHLRSGLKVVQLVQNYSLIAGLTHGPTVDRISQPVGSLSTPPPTAPPR